MKTSLLILCVLIVTALILWQCQRPTYTKSDFPDKRLSFGSGGGYTGAVTTYHLLPNGQIFKSEGIEADTTLHSSIKKREANSFFKQLEEMNFMEMEFNHPGNIYKFINYRTEEGENKVTWGSTNEKPEPNVKDLYKNLNELSIAQKTN